VDVLAHHGVHKIGQTGWDGYRLSLGGVSSVALTSFLLRNPEITDVSICLDADKAGIDATNCMIQELLNDKRFSHMKITIATPPAGNKDYADTLLTIKMLHLDKSRIDRPMERR